MYSLSPVGSVLRCTRRNTQAKTPNATCIPNQTGLRQEITEVKINLPKPQKNLKLNHRLPVKTLTLISPSIIRRQRLHLPRLRCGIVGDFSSPLKWHFRHAASSFEARCTSILERAGAALKKRITITIAKIRPITQTIYISVLALACSVGIYLKRDSLFKKREEGRYIFCCQ